MVEKALLILFSAVGIDFVGSCNAPISNCAGFVPGRSYRILNKGKKAYVSYEFTSGDQTCILRTIDTSGSNTQGFTLETFNSGYKIRQDLSATARTVNTYSLGWSNENGGYMRTESDSTFNIKEMRLEDAGDGWCRITPVTTSPSKYYDARNGLNLIIIQYELSGSDDQMWKFVTDDDCVAGETAAPLAAPTTTQPGGKGDLVLKWALYLVCANFHRVDGRRVISNAHQHSVGTATECARLCLALGPACASFSFPKVTPPTECRLSSTTNLAGIDFQHNPDFNAYVIE